MSLPQEVRARYVAIIDGLLENADLTTITVKSIREGIQDQVEYDITPQKSAIKELIGERFDLANAKRNPDLVVASVEPIEPQAPAAQINGHHSPPSSPTKQNGTTNGVTAVKKETPAKREAESSDTSDINDSPPPKKKLKATEDQDAALAARLQAEEDNLTRPRRGGASRKAAPVKKKTRKKPRKDKITASDDSDLDGVEKKDKPVRKTGFHKPMMLSPALSSLFDGEVQMSRPEITSRIWKYIKANNLQDERDKRNIICDAKLKDVFRQDKVNMFTMAKLISAQLYNPDE